eukprot:CAMPEP_0119042988 /NCGR_PEP_ID=MMETSP1177-20130426/16324_1 /TAXON_ID=2985 /ORGANISM="Ochromonas sp, Strain CCMP1899" /LENGTH=261 /DNA_ID=CAMNT_0007010131 /DNA_START=1339 /DNA_END=2124 /DNA_ORIENTATION=+
MKSSTGSDKLSTGSEKFGTGSGRNGKFIAGGGKGGSDFRPLIRGRLSFDSYNDSVNSDMNDDDSDESLDKVSNKLDNMVIVERNNGGDIVKGMSRSVDMTVSEKSDYSKRVSITKMILKELQHDGKTCGKLSSLSGHSDLHINEKLLQASITSHKHLLYDGKISGKLSCSSSGNSDLRINEKLLKGPITLDSARASITDQKDRQHDSKTSSKLSSTSSGNSDLRINEKLLKGPITLDSAIKVYQLGEEVNQKRKKSKSAIY